MAEQRPPCTAKRANGSPCTLTSLKDSEKCFAHAADLHEARVKGGQGKSAVVRAARHLPPHLTALQGTLIEMIEGVRQHEVTRNDAEAVGVLAARLIDLAKFALENGETKALERKVKDLQSSIEETVRAATA